MNNKVLTILTAIFSLVAFGVIASPNAPDISNKKELLDKLFQTQYETYIGNKDAKVVIYDFFDYNCSDCKDIAPVLEKLVKENSNIKVVFVDYPILRPPAKYAAQMAIEALKQGKYLPVHEAFMARVGRFATEAEVDSAAQQNGVDISKLKSDDSANAYLFKNLELGHKLELKAVPTLFIGYAAEPHDVSVIAEPKADELLTLVSKYTK